MSVIHTYKTWPSFFGSILTGDKTFECRKDDRDPAPKVGDWIELREYEPGHERYTDRLIRLPVSYVLRDSEHCPPGYIIIGFPNPNLAAQAQEIKTLKAQWIDHTKPGCGPSSAYCEELRLKVSEQAAVIEAAKKARAGGPYTPMFDALDKLAAPQPAQEKKAVATDTECLDWLDRHCSFVADHEYKIGPYKIGELRKMAYEGILTDILRGLPAPQPAQDAKPSSPSQEKSHDSAKCECDPND